MKAYHLVTKTERKIYIAGPMTGYEHFNFYAFDTCRDHYKQLGWEVFNPADHDRNLLGKEKDWIPEEKDSEGPWLKWSPEAAKHVPSLRDMLGADLVWIAKEATSIHMLKGWENSKGAKAEWALAHALGLDIR